MSFSFMSKCCSAHRRTKQAEQTLTMIGHTPVCNHLLACSRIVLCSFLQTMILTLICCANNCNPPAFHTVPWGNGSLWQADLTEHSQRRWKHARDSSRAAFNTEHSLSVYAKPMCCGVWRRSVKVRGWHNICLLWMNVAPLYMDI